MKNQVDIVVYTNPAMLKHKREDCYKGVAECFWTFGRFPRKLREKHLEKLRDEWREQVMSEMTGPQPPAPAPLTIHDFAGKLYIAVKGQVVGSFDIEMVEEEDNEVIFYSNSWRELEKPIHCKPFRGFRYRWWGK